MQMHKTGGSIIGLHFVKNRLSCGWDSVGYWYEKQFCANSGFSLKVHEDSSNILCRYLLVSDELMRW